MSTREVQFPNDDALTVDHSSRLGDGDQSIVEAHMVIWAQAENVLDDVGSVVWPSKRPNVGTFGIPASGREFDDHAAHLTRIVVFPLDPLGYRRSAHSALNLAGTSPGVWVTRRWSRGVCQIECGCVVREFL